MQQQYISVKQQVDHITEYINTIKPFNFGYINTEVKNVIDACNTNGENLTATEVNKNTERVQERTRTYDGNFRLLFQTLRHHKALKDLRTVYGDINTVSPAQS